MNILKKILFWVFVVCTGGTLYITKLVIEKAIVDAKK